MANYELTFKKSVAKDLRACPKQDVKRILQRIRALSEDRRVARNYPVRSDIGSDKVFIESSTKWQTRY